MLTRRKRHKHRFRFHQAMADGVDDDFPIPEFENTVDEAISTGGENDTTAVPAR